MRGQALGSSSRTALRRRWAVVREVVAYIENNFAERINLQDLADVADLSIFRLVTVFRNEIGVPPHRYLCHVRVRHAQTLLGRGVPPAIAASEAGFFDQSHLSRHFKRICGITPGQYVAQARLSSDSSQALSGPGRRVTSAVPLGAVA